MKLYHKTKEIAIAAAEFALVAYMLLAVMVGYVTACIGLYAAAPPDWYAYGVRVTLGVPLAALIGFAAWHSVRLAVRMRRPVRSGVIGAETICKIMGGKR